MACDEDEAEKVVADMVVERCVEIRDCPVLLGFELESDLLMFAIQTRAPSQMIDRAMLRGCHEPGGGIIRNTRLRPLLEGRDERVLREILGEPDIAHYPGDPRDEPGGFDSPDCVDRFVCIGSRHGYQSDHLPAPVQGWRRIAPWFKHRERRRPRSAFESATLLSSRARRSELPRRSEWPPSCHALRSDR